MLLQIHFYKHITTHVYVYLSIYWSQSMTFPMEWHRNSRKELIFAITGLARLIKERWAINLWRVSSQNELQCISILLNLRYLLKYKENNQQICNTLDYNFKNILFCIMKKVSLERYYFVLYNHGALTLEMSKMVLNSFCNKTLHL